MSSHTIKTKINSRCIIDLNIKTIKSKNKKSSRRKDRISLRTWNRQRFTRQSTESMSRKIIKDKLDYIKMKIFCSPKNFIKKINRQVYWIE